jgi:hypothetical protein
MLNPAINPVGSSNLNVFGATNSVPIALPVTLNTTIDVYIKGALSFTVAT